MSWPRLALAAVLGLALALPVPAAAAGEPVHAISPGTSRIELMRSATLVDDPAGEMTPQGVLQVVERGGGVRVSAAHFSYVGFDTRRVAWFVFRVSAVPAAERSWLLEIARPELRVLQLFVSSPDGRWTASPETGMAFPFSARPVAHRNHVLPVHIEPGESTLLLRVQNDMVGEIRPTLWTPQALVDHDFAIFCFSWLFFGLIGGMFVYNLLLYIMVRDLGYLLYVAGIGFGLLGYLGTSGLGAQFLWGEWTWWSGRMMGVAWGGATFFRVALARYFLGTRRRLPWADKALAGSEWAALAAIAVSLLLPRHIGAVAVLLVGVLTSFLIDGVSILAVVRRWPGAPYYFASWMVLSAGIVGGFSRFNGVLPSNVVTINILPIAAALSYQLLSIALAHQINEEKRQKERAQAATLALLQASQAFRLETQLDRLHARVQAAIKQLTGATEVRFAVRDPHVEGSLLAAYGQGSLPATVITEVERTREPLVVADALRDGRFSGDEAFAGADRCSIMALPILHQGALSAVLVLENRDAAGAFSESAIDTLLSIAGPLAVSLENSMLYERLEQRVAEQTQALRETQQELMSTARRAGMAEIATNVLHNVGNVLNSVNVSADLIRTQLRNSKTSGLAQAVDLMEAHAGALGAFMQQDPRGQLLPRYLRQLSDALAREREALMAHAEQVMASVDHIKHIVATQQAYAGSSALLESLQPSVLVEEALRLTGDALERHGVEVVREFGAVPPVRLDKTRVLQILVNLVNNAKDAMDGVTDRRRTLRLKIDAAGGMLRFQVRDDGCGISKENLTRIFTHGFSTRRGGHGFGLHSCALAAAELGGSLSAQSGGPGLGATFTLQFPLERR